MLVILNEDIEGIGERDDVVNVDDAYAQDCLIPEGLASKATSSEQALHDIEERPPVYERWRHERHDEVEEIGDRLSRIEIIVLLEGKDASVTEQDIANAVKLQTGLILGAGKIHLDQPIQTPGRYIVPVRPHQDVEFDLTIQVVSE